MKDIHHEIHSTITTLTAVVRHQVVTDAFSQRSVALFLISQFSNYPLADSEYAHSIFELDFLKCLDDEKLTLSMAIWYAEHQLNINVNTLQLVSPLTKIFRNNRVLFKKYYDSLKVFNPSFRQKIPHSSTASALVIMYLLSSLSYVQLEISDEATRTYTKLWSFKQHAECIAYS